MVWVRIVGVSDNVMGICKDCNEADKLVCLIIFFSFKLFNFVQCHNEDKRLITFNFFVNKVEEGRVKS